jgi:hypothetical protein
MSIKEFFAFSIIKPQVIEYLKNKADFTSLGNKYKKPFRGHIVREVHVDEPAPQSRLVNGPFGKLN